MRGRSVPAMPQPQEEQAPPEEPTASPIAPKNSLVSTWWVRAVVAAIVAGCVVAFWIFYSAPSSVPASASILVDDFTRDQSLPTGLWTINGPVGSVVASDSTSPASTLVKPELTFSSQSGLGFGGVTGKGQAATIESVASFEAPFTVEADVMPGGREGSPFGLIVADRSGQKGVGILRRLGSAAAPGGIDYIAPEPGAGWKSQGALRSSPQANTWYTLSLSLDAQGAATVAVRDGPEVIGRATLPTGKGPFNILLRQEGVGGSATDHGQVFWRSVKAFSGTVTLPAQAGEHANPAAANLSYQPASGPSPISVQPPIVRDAVIRTGRTSLTLPPGRSLYLYGMVTGGALPSSSFLKGQYAQVADADGQVAVALAATPLNKNSYTTATGFFVIGGVAVSGFSHHAASYGSNGASGASSASDTFTLSQKSLVVMIGLASSQQSISLTGVPGLKTDALSSGPGASLGMIIAHAYLPPGDYTVTEHSAALAGGQDPNHMTDLIGVFAFQ
jgi:hypothetical protein